MGRFVWSCMPKWGVYNGLRHSLVEVSSKPLGSLRTTTTTTTTRTPQNNGINEPKQYSARAFYSFVHFFTVICKTTTWNDQILGFLENVSAWRQVFLRFLCFNTVHNNLGPGLLASSFHVKQIGIIAKELQKREVIFWNDVLVAVVVVVVVVFA